MILGTVKGKNPTVLLTLRGFNDEEMVLEAVIDTGFDAALSLPLDVVQKLNLLKTDDAMVTLADATMIIEDLYTVIVEWDGIEKMVLALASGRDTLVGMAMMDGYNLSVDVTEGGEVRLSRLGGELPFTPTAP